PPASARTALLPPRNTSCPPTATLVSEISSASFGSTPAPRFRASALGLPLLDSVWPSAWFGDSSAPSSPLRFPVSVPRFSLAPILRRVAIPCSSSLSFPIWPPVETSRLGDISIVVTSSKGDISNVAAWGHYQSRATQFSFSFCSFCSVQLLLVRIQYRPWANHLNPPIDPNRQKPIDKKLDPSR